MKRLVKIIDKDHELFGKIVNGGLVYYDIHHTGEGPDLFEVEADERRHRLLSNQIDVEHYNAQLLAGEMARLGAKVGDSVMITKSGSGSFIHGWDLSEPHKISKICYSGQVLFDGYPEAGASIFRPQVIAAQF